MQKAYRKLYDTYYNHKPIVEEEVEEETDFAKLAMKKLIPKTVKDQYQEYITGSRVLQDPGNLFHWWASQTHISTSQLPAVRPSGLSAVANIQSLITETA
jgi:hypothetical protein